MSSYYSWPVSSTIWTDAGSILPKNIVKFTCAKTHFQRNLWVESDKKNVTCLNVDWSFNIKAWIICWFETLKQRWYFIHTILNQQRTSESVHLHIASIGIVFSMLGHQNKSQHRFSIWVYIKTKQKINWPDSGYLIRRENTFQAF